MRPTRGFTCIGPGQPYPPIWPCSTRGFPCLRCCHRSGGLLPHLFTLTKCARPEDASPRCYLGPAAEAFAHRRSIFCGTFRSRAANALSLARRATPWRYQARCPVTVRGAPVERSKGFTIDAPRRINGLPRLVAEPRSLDPVGAQHAVPSRIKFFGVRTFLPPPLARLRGLRTNRRSPDSPAD